MGSFNLYGSNSSSKGSFNLGTGTTQIPLKTKSGKEFGNISYGAYKAIEENTLDSYKPKNDEEKSVLDRYKEYCLDMATANKRKNYTHENIYSRVEELKKIKPEEYEYDGKYDANLESDALAMAYTESQLSEIAQRTKNAKNAYRSPAHAILDFVSQPASAVMGNKAYLENEERIAKGKEERTESTRKAESTLSVVESAKQTKSNMYGTAYTEAKDDLGTWAMKQVDSGAAQFNKGMSSSFDFIAEKLDDILPTEFLGRYDFISNIHNFTSNLKEGDTKYLENSQSEAYKSSTSRGKGWKTAGDVLSGTVAAAPHAILAMITAGYSLGATGTSISTQSAASTTAMLKNAVTEMLKNPAYYTSLLMTLGTDYEEAKERGANSFIASSYAILASSVNAGVEVGGGVEKLAGELKGEGAQTFSKSLLYWIKSSLEEGGEEVVQGIVSNATAKLLFDHNVPVASVKDDTAVFNPVKSAEEFAMGTAVGAILGGAQTTIASAVNAKKVAKAGKYYNEPEAVEALIETGLESPKETQSYKLAEKLSKKKAKPTNYEVGRLFYANVAQIETEERRRKGTTTEKAEKDVADNSIGADISVGDIFISTDGKKRFEIVGRDENNTVIKSVAGDKTLTRTFKNADADKILANTQFQKLGAEPVAAVTNEVTEKAAEEAPVATNEVASGQTVPEYVKADTDGTIRFNQSDIDYSDNTMREGKFYVRNAKNPSGRIEVDGFIIGKYGVHNDESGKFTVTHLQSGTRMAQVETLDEAQQLAKYLNDNVSFNDISYRAVEGKGYVPNAANEFASEVKRIVAEKPYLAEDAEAVENEVQAEEIKYPHLYDEDKVSQEFIDAVNEDIEKAIINIRKGNLDAVPEVIEVVELDETSIKTLSDFLGYDISGYTVKIERDRLLHIERRHGINGEHDHSLSDPKDTARMGYVLNHGNDIDWVVDDKGNKVFDTQYNDKNNKPSPVIMISSKVDGTYCVSQAAPESRKKTLWITSARIQKADVGSQVPNSSTATPQLQTSETPLDSSSASNNSISNESEIVNSDGLTSEETSGIIEEKDSGREATIYTTDNEPVKVRYRVVSADELIASNDADGTVNKNYPRELQPRDRTREASQRQIREMANNIQPERLGESANVSDGAPIIGSDMVVESGNGRVLAIREMYRLGKGNSYIDYIKKNADKFGIDITNIPEKPVLVRERISEVDREKFVKKANESGLSSMSATEKAKLDAEKLTSDILDLFVPNEDGNINTVDNRSFIKAVIGGVFVSNELNSVVDANGNLSAVGLERITNAVFYKAYGDDSLAARLAESLDNDIKNVTKVLLNVAPRVAKIKSDIESGILYDIDFSEDIVGAAKLFSYLKDSGMKLEAYLSQLNLFDDYSDIAIEIANVFEQKNRGAKQATEFLNIVLDLIEEAGNPNQISLMSTKILTKEEIIHNAISEFNGRDETRTNIAVAHKGEQADGRGTQAVSDAETAHEGNRSGEKSEVESRDRSSGQKNSRSKRAEEIKIAVGDVFFSNLDEKTYRIIERTNDTTSVEVTSGNKKDVLTMSNTSADEVFIGNDGLIKVETAKEKTAGETKNDKPTPKRTAKPESVETTVKIEDFGEKIGGARKDLWSSRGLFVGDLEGMNDREREKNVKKDNVWKRPNYRSLVEAGGDRSLLWAVNEIRKSLNQTIYYGYKATEATKTEKQKVFIETIREIQAMAETAKTKQDFEDMGEKWLIDNGYLVENETGHHRYSYTQKYYENPALGGGKYFETIRYIVKNFDNLTKIADRDQFAIDAKSKVPKGFSIVGGKNSVGSKLVNGEWVKDETYSVVKGRIIVQSGFETREAALEWLNKTVAKKKGKTRFIPKQLLEVHRKGPDYRGGKSVDGQNYIDTFGFKGGEFGNWMSTKDRQVSLDYGFDALKDLADVLGIEDTDISFGGNLSIAFGARGQGLSGAAAHYENLRRVINLTKMNGAGSLAHEWFHALDDFIGGYTDNYATNNQHTLPENTKTAIRNLITAMRYRDATQEETDLAQQHRYERAVKSVTYQLENLFKWVKKVEDGTLTDYDVQYFKRKPTKADAEKYRRLYNSLIETGDKAYIKELSKLRKEVYGHVISAEDTVNLEMRLLPLTPEAKNNVQLARKATDFYNNSQRFGQIHSKDGDYWDSTVEMAARAFACYVADKTHKQNDYLSAHSDNAVTLDMDKDENPVVVRAFPVGEERIAINSAFDDLFAALKADGFLHEREQTEKPSEISYSLEGDESNSVADYEAEDNFLIEKPLEQTKTLIAVHNITEDKLIDAIERGGLLMPSLAVTKASEGFSDFGDISVVFGKDSIDPSISSANKLYGADAWTPAQTELKLNPTFNDNKVGNFIRSVVTAIGKGGTEIFDMTKSELKSVITKADGSVYSALAHDIGVQTAYAVKNHLLTVPRSADGTIDRIELKQRLDEKLDKDAEWRKYKQWLNSVSNELITSYERATNEDILNNMKAQPNSAKTFRITEDGELTVPAVEYDSIEEYKANEGRLSKDAEVMTKEVGQRFLEWSKGVQEKTGVPIKTIIDAINVAFEARYSTTDIGKIFAENSIAISRNDSKALQELYKRTVELPTSYFEAKPGRMISLREIKEIIIPRNASQSLRDKITQAGLNYSEYETGNENDRVEKLNNVSDVKFSIESEEDYGKAGNLLHNGSEQRHDGERSGEQVAGLVKATEKGSETAEERKRFAEGLTTEQLVEKILTDRDGNRHKYVEIKQEAWNPSMTGIADFYKQKGVTVHFLKGNVEIAFAGKDRAARAMRVGNDIYVSYDHATFTPEQLAMHEYVHIQYQSEEVQSAKKAIFDKLSAEEKQALLDKVKEAYGGIISEQSKLEEEIVCNILSGMYRSTRHQDVVNSFWSTETDAIDNFKVAEYTESTDAGGADYAIDHYWHTDLSKRQIEQVVEWLSRTGAPEATRITDTANWYKGRINGNDLFVIYSTENAKKPTILYEVKGGKAKAELDALQRMLEVIENGNIKIQENISRLLSGDWVQEKHDMENNDAGPGGRTGNTGYAAVLQGKSPQLIGSQAFRNVVYNLFKIQEGVSYSLDTDGIADLDDLIGEYGEIEPGENPVREVHVPKKISENRYVSRFARTMMEAGVTPDDMLSEFEARILDGTLTHEPITNDAARESAIKDIKHLGFEGALNKWEVLSDSGKVGKEELALGLELYNQCITNKDTYNTMKLAAALSAEATRAGRTLQACRMLKLMSPDGQLYYLEKSVEKMNEELRESIGKKFKDIELDEELMRKFLEAKDEAERNAAYDALCQNIADQIPPTWRDKWNSWRYLAMLGNPRTHIRNIVGNAVFVPAIRLKTYAGAVLERAFKVDTAKRTKALWKSKEAVAFAKSDFTEMQKVLQGENAKYAVTNDIDGKRTIFKTKWLEKLRNKNFEWLEKEDIWFLKLHYVDALARLLTVRKIDPNNVNQNQLEEIRAIAVREAQAATYRDANALADALTKMERNINRSGSKPLKLAGFVLEGVMPFKKTPLNIAKQGVAYSPVGILSAVYKTLKKVQNSEAYKATAIIDDLAKGLTGTAIMLIGCFLASMGLISGGDDEDKKKKAFDKMVGEQSYALQVGDKSYTIDWMTPSCLPVFIGVELYNLAKDELSFRDIMDATGTLAEPLLELSVFSGVSDAIETAQYNSTNALTAVLTDAVSSYILQALPTLGGQASRIIDKNRREYYFRDKNSELPAMLQSFIGQASSKIPFASYLFEPSIDNWGREETYGNVFERAFENTVSPGYYSEENYTKVDYELRRLYAQTGDNAVFPTTQVKYYVVGGLRYDMTAEDYTAVKKYRGKLSFKLVKELINSSRYKAMSDEEKARAIAKCYEQAGKETKAEMLDRVKRHSRK